MVQWSDIIFGHDEPLPCILQLEKEGIRVDVFQHPVPEVSSGVGYLIEVYSFSDLREEWQLIGKLGDFDLHTIIGLLVEAATMLYRTRATSLPPQPPNET